MDWFVLLKVCPPWILQLLALKGMSVISGQIQALNLIFSVPLVTLVTLVQRFKVNFKFFVRLALDALKEPVLHREIDSDVSQVFTVLLDLYLAHQKQLNVR